MDLAQIYQQWNQAAPGTLNMFQKHFVGFYKAFLYENRWKLYLTGLGSTVKLTVLALLLGLALGLVVSVVRAAHDQQRPGRRNLALGAADLLCRVYTTVIRGTPMMVQLLIWGFVVFKSSRNRDLIAVLGLGINSGAYVAEILRGGLMSVDAGQSEAGRSLGMGYLDTMRFIVIPQAFKNILPALGNEFITLFKDTSLVSVISGKDLVYYAKAVGTKTYDVMYPYVGIALIYLVAVVFMTWLQGKLERRLRQSDRR